MEKDPPEAQIQEFLATHIYFWNGALRLAGGGAPLYQKLQLGSEFEVDFAFVDPGSTGAEWHLVEIEKAGLTLFNANGDPSAPLTHAIGQIRDWQTWIAENLSTARRLMPGIDHPAGLVFAGRRHQLDSTRAKERLRALNLQLRPHVEVRTLDRFVAMANSASSLRGTDLPVRALTHKELQHDGLPDDVLKFIDSHFGRRREFLADRQDQEFFDEDIRFD